MMTREEVIGELIRLKKEYADTGELESTLWGHFGYEVDHGEAVWVEDGDKIVAFCDWSWVSSPQDVEDSLNGKKTSGDVLLLINVVCTRPNLIWKLRRLLPGHKWIIGVHISRAGRIRAPKGIPDHFMQVA